MPEPVKVLRENEPLAAGFFGRRKGKALREEQLERFTRLLPFLKIDLTNAIEHPKSLFPVPVSGLHLEIGFGGGEHLADIASREAGIGFLGCEPFVNGFAKMMGEIEHRGLKNVRLHDGNAIDLLARLPAASVDRIYLLYPDPWPKRRQRKRRFVSPASLKELARVLRPGGEFRFASDIDDYVGWTLQRIATSPDFYWPADAADDWRLPYADWPGTRYEAKAKREGRIPSYLTFIRT